MTDNGQLNPEPTHGPGLRAFNGRYGRKKFWLGALGLLALMIVMLIVFGPMMATTGGNRGGMALIALLSIPFFLLYAKLIVHRLQDLGWSGWWFLLLGPLLIPLPMWMWTEAHTQAAANSGSDFALEFGGYAIFFGGFILMGCVRGTNGPNKYGPDPIPKSSPPGDALPG